MKIGISTYAYFWQISDQVEKKLTVHEMIRKTKEYGADVFQICDYSPIEEMNEVELKSISDEAKRLKIELELGTRGIQPNHLKKYLRIANALDVKLVRTMINDKNHTPSMKQAEKWIKENLQSYIDSGVTIALETYEQIKTEELINLVKLIDNPYVGICLDPGNSIAALELPEQVIQTTAPYVVNLHVKDFVFTRKDGWVGFSLIGCPLGEGALNLQLMLTSLANHHKTPNAIIEFWLPFNKTIKNTIEMENQWLRESIKYLQETLVNYKISG